MTNKNDKLINEYFINQNLDLQQIVNDFTNYVLTIIKNITKDVLTSEDIEELISDIFFILWKNKEKLNLNMPLIPYLSAITKNLTKNKLRNINLSYYSQLDPDDIVASTFNVEDIVEDKNKLEIIYKELQKDSNGKLIFIMFYAQNKKAKDIAKELNLTEFNVNTKLHRLRKKIKKELEKRGYTYGK